MKTYSKSVFFALPVFALSLFSLSAFADDKTSQTSPVISGAIEIEAGFTDESSDIALATFELGIDHSLTDKVEGHVLFLYEEGENNDNIAVDEAIVTINPKENFSIAAGRMYVPFGHFDSNMVSDPLTLEIGETQEEAIQLGFLTGNISTAIYAFKDDEDSSDKIDDFGVNFDYETEAFSAGLSYITDVNDKSDVSQSAKGLAVHAKGSFGRTTLIAEHLTVDTGNKPSASNLELGIDLGADRILAFALQKTKDAAALDLPEKSFGIAYGMPIYDSVGFAAEVVNNEAYDGSDDTVVTLQLAYEF